MGPVDNMKLSCYISDVPSRKKMKKSSVLDHLQSWELNWTSYWTWDNSRLTKLSRKKNDRAGRT